MIVNDLLIDGIERSREVCHEVLRGLTPDQANARPGGDHNSISWLVWHIAREQDVQIAPLCGTPQVWTSQGWFERFDLDLPARSMGYGHDVSTAGKVVVDDTDLLLGYLDAAVDATRAYIASVGADQFDDIVDDRWDPPVTRGVRLVSVIDDAAQHAGQAAYVRGLLFG
ncbi:mycothiol transferase [Raineyella fluvialis]|uniref:DUF664 domain-containing protein n=1 Tax=Raineyella fluvialis TaxID=2662261 RepID=A0A5Q2FGV5_9ACTN|nr:DUF664 domain-containing protein [Raineyella fluvialis]QGF24343.1 DUF664 domain-containing protein [Raineyella fluvialis]